MANISVTNTFADGTATSAPQVNENFSDIINGLTDGTKDLSVSALTVAGALSVTDTISATNLQRTTGAALTASATQTQAGGYAITKDYNQFTVVATTGDAATLPTAVAGREIYIANISSRNMQIFPASGANIDGGTTDASKTLALGDQALFRAISTTKWYSSDLGAI